MIDFSKYFIVGTNSNALHDTMNGMVVGELIRCKDCKYYNPQQHYCEGIGNWFGYDDAWSDNGYCYKAELKEKDE